MPERPLLLGTMQIRAGLSHLGKTADGLRPAYLKLQVEGTSMSSADPLAGYIHIQTLLLRGNELTNLQVGWISRACRSIQRPAGAVGKRLPHHSAH